MKRALSLFCVACLWYAGASFAGASQDVPLDAGGLLDADPDAVTLQGLKDRADWIEDNYQAFHSVNGIIWKGVFADAAHEHPSLYGTGGDSALFTGFYLAAAVYRFLVTRDDADLDTVFGTVRGLHILTHASGVPGVIARCAFPADRPGQWRYPDAWRSRIETGLVYESPDDVADMENPANCYPAFVFYTRATRDQLTGILFGLGVALALLDPEDYAGTGHQFSCVTLIRDAVRRIACALWNRLEQKCFIIMDHRNRTGSTAVLVDGLLKVQLLAVYRAALGGEECARIEELYLQEFRAAFFLNDGNVDALFNRSSLTGSYYAYNLRLARSFTVSLLESDGGRRATAARYMTKHVWRYVGDHRNSHFNMLYAAASRDETGLEDALRGLKELSLRPLRSFSSPLFGLDCYPPPLVLLYGDVSGYVVPVHLRKPTGYFIWQKDPFATGDGEPDPVGSKEATGLDFLLPYWMGRFYGFVDAP